MLQPLNFNHYQQVIQKIQAQATVYNDLPCVVIIHDLKDWRVVHMSANGLKQLQLTQEEVTAITAEEYYSRYFNNEDAQDYVPKILGFLEQNNNEETVTYFQQVRFPGYDGWNWHMSSTKIFYRDEEGNPLYVITTSVPIDAMHHMTAKASRLLDENNFLRKNYQHFSTLTKREKEVLKLTALGKSSAEIAAQLFISVTTAETHRRNLRNKLKANTSYELSQYARAFDLI
jgi:DNA-binding CsgD family transcriptional regulator